MNLLLHPHTTRQLAGAARDRAGSYIFHGLRSSGKATAAVEFARQLNCLGDDPQGVCRHCRQFEAGNYPDLHVVKPEDKPSITIEQIRQLLSKLSLSLYNASGVRVVIVDGADALTVDAQNAMLKLLEEPPPQTFIILVTQRIDSLLITVRSRTAEVYFAPVEQSKIRDLLVVNHGVQGSVAATMARAAAGAPGIAIALASEPADDDLIAVTALAKRALAASLFERLLLAKSITDAKVDVPTFGQLLHAQIIERIKADEVDPAVAARQLEALELLRRHLKAKLTPKLALERLMVSL